jgi:hypothetical protein
MYLGSQTGANPPRYPTATSIFSDLEGVTVEVLYNSTILQDWMAFSMLAKESKIAIQYLIF